MILIFIYYYKPLCFRTIDIFTFEFCQSQILFIVNLREAMSAHSCK